MPQAVDALLRTCAPTCVSTCAPAQPMPTHQSSALVMYCIACVASSLAGPEPMSGGSNTNTAYEGREEREGGGGHNTGQQENIGQQGHSCMCGGRSAMTTTQPTRIYTTPSTSNTPAPGSVGSFAWQTEGALHTYVATHLEAYSQCLEPRCPATAALRPVAHNQCICTRGCHTTHQAVQQAAAGAWAVRLGFKLRDGGGGQAERDKTLWCSQLIRNKASRQKGEGQRYRADIKGVSMRFLRAATHATLTSRAV